MIFDTQNLFSDDQAITATAASTNVLDLGAPGTPHGAAAALDQDIGRGTMIPLRIQVTEAFDNLTSLKIAIETDSVEAFSSATEVLSATVLLADLVAGYVAPIDKFPRGTAERYVRLQYTVTGTAPTTGKITAGVVAANQTND